jgi:hypothetical protein
MPSDYTYDIHKTVEAAQFRHRERDFGHLRALKRDEPTDGIVHRIMGGLLRRRTAALHPPISARDGYVLTDKVCRLADGATGRIAVRESQGTVTEVCVVA